MIKYENENADRSITGKRVDIFSELCCMLPISITNANVCIITKDGEHKEYYERSLFDAFIDMEEEELSFIKDYFGHLLEPKSLMKIKKENKRAYDLLMAILAYKSKYGIEGVDVYEDEERFISSFIIDFNKEEIVFYMIDSTADNEEDATKGIKINRNKEIILS